MRESNFNTTNAVYIAQRLSLGPHTRYLRVKRINWSPLVMTIRRGPHLSMGSSNSILATIYYKVRRFI